MELLKEGAGASFVWSFTSLELLGHFRSLCVATQITEFVQYQMRHSGVSIDLLEGSRDIAAAQKRGRWKAYKSMVRYEKHAKLQAVAASYEVETLDYLRRAAAHFEDAFWGRPHPVVRLITR